MRFAAIGLALAAARVAAADTLVLMWNPNPEPNVTAYRVFVGTSPGVVDSTFDVPGWHATFAFDTAVRGRRYYFSVAAQVDDDVWGPKSVEVSEVAAAASSSGEGSRLPAAPEASALAVAPAGAADDTAAPPTIMADHLLNVSALVVSPAGAGFVVEDTHTVRAFDGRGLQPEPALQLDDDARVESLALAPDFDRTGRVVLAVSRTARGGVRETALERYRSLGGALGEGVVLVPSVEEPAASVALTADGRVFVAQGPAVVAFHADGTPLSQRTTGPTQAVAVPPVRPASSLLHVEAGDALWMVSQVSGGDLDLLRISSEGSAAARVVPFVGGKGRPSVVQTANQVVLVQPTTGGLHLTDVTTGTIATLSVALPPGTEPVLAAPLVGGWYLVVHRDGRQGEPTDGVVFAPAPPSGR